MRLDLTIACCMVVLLTGCTVAKAQGSSILSDIGGKKDNALVAKVQGENPGSLCSLATKDGHARLMSFGPRAVVDINGTPAVLDYHPPVSGQASFTGAGVRISGDLPRDDVTELGKTISHGVTVEVRASGRVEHLDADWTCQKSLIVVRKAR